MLHRNELITIEEETLLNVATCRNGMQRKFTLTNQSSKFCFGVLTSGGSIVSIKVNNGNHEIILPTSIVSYLPLNNSSCNHQIISPATNSSNNKRDLESYPSYCEWISHVLGSDTLLLTTSSSQSLVYQLTSSDEFIITGKVKNSHAIAPFYFNLNNVSSTINGHFIHLRCLDSIHYEVIACSPPATGSNYNNIANNINIDHSNSSVNSTSCNSLSTSNVDRFPVKFDIIRGTTITIDDNSCYVDNDENIHHCNNVNQSSLIQDTVYAIVPVINYETNSSSSPSPCNDEGKGSIEYIEKSPVNKLPADGSDGVSSLDCNKSLHHVDSNTQPSSSSSSIISSMLTSGNSKGNSTISSVSLTPPSKSLPSSSSSSASSSSTCIEAPVLVLTLSYEGRSIEMSLQCNSNASPGQNYCSSSSNNVSSNHLLNTSPYSSSSASLASSFSSPFASTSSSSNFTNSSGSNGLQYDLVKLRVRIRRDGISFMPVGMNDFKCIYKVKW